MIMSKASNSLDAVLAAMPAVQEQARLEIAARLAAGETIAGSDEGDGVKAARCSLDELRMMLKADQKAKLARTAPMAQQSTAA
jgi:hypothetical protein